MLPNADEINIAPSVNGKLSSRDRVPPCLLSVFNAMTTGWIETPRLHTGPLSQHFDELSGRKSVQIPAGSHPLGLLNSSVTF